MIHNEMNKCMKTNNQAQYSDMCVTAHTDAQMINDAIIHYTSVIK